MIKVCKQNKESVLGKVCSGKLDAVAASISNFPDEVMLAMHQLGILQCLLNVIPDKRKHNAFVPFYLILALAITAKMKLKTSMSDIPFATQDHRLLSELGYNIIDADGVNKGLMSEGTLRFLFEKYESQDWFKYYNEAIQNEIMPKLKLKADIHILDTTDVEVNLKNSNYEGSTVTTSKKGGPARGYKLATLRGIVDDTGIIEDVRFGDIKTNDLPACEDLIFHSPVLKRGDILIADRGFISRDVVNYSKSIREVDLYIPLRCDMNAFEMAVSTAKLENKWIKHPNPKRKTQKIAFVSNLGAFWKGDHPKDNVDFNACVVWDTKPDDPDDTYRVFITTDLTKNAKQIVKTYELRCEVEEDYRQLKDAWKLEGFHSTDINLISFHIMCVLFAYSFFQIYTMLPEGQKYAHKSLPSISKNYQSKNLGSYVFYVDDEFGIFTFIEVLKLYESLDNTVKTMLDPIFEKV